MASLSSKQTNHQCDIKGHFRSNSILKGHDLGLISSDKHFKDIMNNPVQALSNYISGMPCEAFGYVSKTHFKVNMN